MLEAAFSKFGEKISELIIQHSEFVLQDEQDLLEQTQDDVRHMQCLSEDADSKGASSEMSKKWVSEARAISHNFEDVIDNFSIQEAQRKRRRLWSLVYAPVDLWAKTTLVKDIKKIKKRQYDLYQKRSNYGIGNLGGHGADRRLRRQTSPLLDDSEVVGVENDMETLVALLTDGESSRRVVCIVGMGGLGKTTVARKVYNNEEVKRHFACRAWICVSQDYNCRDLLLALLASEDILQDMLSEMVETDGFGWNGTLEKLKEKLIKSLEETSNIVLKEKLFLCLQRKRYLVVLDDAWDRTAWDLLVSACPNTNLGSRILLTTRNKAVVSRTQCIFHELKCLGEEESWKLFCMTAFPEQGIQCPQNLEQTGKEIVAKCHGLPLAIVLMAGLLSGKEKLEYEWEKVLRNICSNFHEANPQMEEILALSYNDLPIHLKHCFLYLGILTKNHEIYAEKLIRLWIAEGFIEPSMNGTPEEVAEKYLDELIERNLLQVARRSCTGQVRSCRIHDCLQDFCISKARESKFLHVNGISPRPSEVRRLALYHVDEIHEPFPFNSLTEKLRSLSYSIRAGERLSENQEKILHSRFKFLKVLDLYGVQLQKLPDEIDTLTLLRYLGCRGSGLECLPSSIGALERLETLDVTSSKIVEISHVIWKMQKLRHFHVNGRITESDNPPVESDFPSNLQTLTHVEASKWVNNYLGKLSCLTKLGMWGKYSSEYASGLSNAIPKLKKLRRLKLGEWDDCYIPALPPLTDHQDLRKLFLHGKLEKLPESHEFPPKLTKLTLRMTKLEHDPMPTLEKLRNLRILKLLDQAYSGGEMVCSAQGFPRLESLHVVYLNHLEEWTVVQGAMPSLQHLHIHYCMNLRCLPEGLRYQASLTVHRIPLEQEIDNKDGKPDF
ncbi:hypothetical protein ACLOJK_003827 [Asimina triloba]